MPKLWIKRGREKGIKLGYLWVHPQDVERISPSAEDGSAVDVVDSKDRFLGRALLNRRSPIVGRIYSRFREEWNETLLDRRLGSSLERRRKWGLDLECCRLVYGEGDFLPGLIVDRYGPAVVLQIVHPAMERFRDHLVAFFTGLSGVEVVCERSDLSARLREGLEQRSGVLWGRIPDEIWIREGAIPLRVDVIKGQKTGFYLDQKQNRMRIGPLASGRRVLDLFCYSGGFGMQALQGGALSVTFVDSSREAIALARGNVEASGWSRRASFVEANAFDLLRQLERQGERYDMVILDPPAFAPSRRVLSSASRGYKELNLRALKLLGAGGILVSSSCSSHMPVGLHLQVISEAAADARRHIFLLHQWGQDLDHPVIPSHPPSRYLKCHVVEVADTWD